MRSKRFSRFEPEELKWYPAVGDHVGYSSRGNGEQFYGVLKKLGRKHCRVKLDRTGKTVTVTRTQLFYAPTPKQIEVAADAVRLRREMEEQEKEDYTC